MRPACFIFIGKRTRSPAPEQKQGEKDAASFAQWRGIDASAPPNGGRTPAMKRLLKEKIRKRKPISFKEEKWLVVIGRLKKKKTINRKPWVKQGEMGGFACWGEVLTSLHGGTPEK